MRVIGEIPHPECKVSLFKWNGKVLVKIERGLLEQTFKISELDITSDEDLRERLVSRGFIDRAVTRFAEMQLELDRLLT